MEDSINSDIDDRIKKTIEGLKRNNISATYVNRKEDAIDEIIKHVKKKDVVSVGGSMTLWECGIIDFLVSNDYKFINQYKDDMTREDQNNIYREVFFSDVYISSSNAITSNGEIYNVDGNGNRIAAIIYGPKSVIVVIGYNKIVDSIDEAVKRVKMISAPSNCIRLNKTTYCSKSGVCIGFDGNMTDGCKSEDRICRSYSVISRQPSYSDRIKVVIVGEPLGY